ncbi:MAG TPA: hypothetical protein VMW24_23350 [Sedimentisphaerales bacterium]|nr:hypothetical protein [Sedimentisphaerales bacterium]
MNDTPFWYKFVSRRFLLALLGVAIVVAGEFFGADEGVIQTIGEKVIWVIVAFIGGESVVDAARNLKK